MVPAGFAYSYRCLELELRVGKLYGRVYACRHTPAARRAQRAGKELKIVTRLAAAIRADPGL